METIFYATYELRPLMKLNARASGAPRRGALLRIGSGFADVHPWPELGDDPLERQLELISRGTPTALGRQSLLCTRLDGEARDRGEWLFEGLTVPASHLTLPSVDENVDWAGVRRMGFGIVKIKGPAQVDGDEIARAALRLRVDYNATGTEQDIGRLIDDMPDGTIDFIEDPTPYDEEVWTRLRQRVAVAADREKSGNACDILVVKPALEDFEENRAQRIVVTSAMDHPLGQLWAAWNAASRGISEVCGLITHHLFEPDSFTERLSTQGPVLVPPRGTGLGFDDLLDAMEWRRLR
jgi:O-succinylbenzoate synthase